MASAGFQDRVFTFHIDGFLFHQDSGNRFKSDTEINILTVRDTSLYATGMIRMGVDVSVVVEETVVPKPSPYSNPFTALIVNIACPMPHATFRIPVRPDQWELPVLRR